MTPNKHALPTQKVAGKRDVVKLLAFQTEGAIHYRFAYSGSIAREAIKQFSHTKYAAAEQCYYVQSDTDGLFPLLFRHFKKRNIWVDITQIKKELRTINRPQGGPARDRREAQKRSKKTLRQKIAAAELSSENKRKLKEFLEWMEQKRYRDSTIHSYLSYLLQFFSTSQKEWHSITEKDIHEYNYLYFIKKGLGYSSQNQWINAVKGFCSIVRPELALRDELLRPKRGKRIPKVLSRKKVQTLLSAPMNIKHRALLCLIYSSGLRIGEALSLKLADIDGTRMLIHIRSGKGNKDRMVPLSEEALKVLRRYWRAYRPKQHLFEGRDGGVYSHSSARQVFKRALRQAGIQGQYRLHDLRHAYATHLLDAGCDLRFIQEILGHASPKTTMIYTHVSRQRLASIRSPLDDMKFEE